MSVSQRLKDNLPHTIIITVFLNYFFTKIYTDIFVILERCIHLYDTTENIKAH
jgi:hypothetical protein